MSPEQNEQQSREISSEVSTHTPSLQEKPEQKAPETGHELVMDIAVQTGEDPKLIAKRTDVATMLEKMKEGVVITLHISRPRFWSRLTLDDLGLGQRAISAEATDIINTYFQLGRRSLLPKRYQDWLGSAESSARSCLARYALKSHWGFFVPLTRYQEWKEDNSRMETEFFEVKDAILTNYEAIIEEMVDAHRPLAEDAWRRLLVGTAMYEQEKLSSTTTALLEEVVEHLRAGHGKESFVENYLECIRAAMPQKQEIEEGFEYRVERGVIPLPSLLARDMEQADRVYQDRAVQDAETQARLAAIEVQRRTEMQKLTLQQQQEREEQHHKLQLERRRQQQQLEMEQDVLRDARRQKERLVQEFYTGIVQQINGLIFSVSDNVLQSLDDHNGILRGPVSAQLRNLVTQLEQLNFVSDEQVEKQIARLRAVLPKPDESDKAAKGLAKIDTSRISTVVRELNHEAELILIDLGSQPKPRVKRQAAMTGEGLLDLGTQRRARPGDVFTSEPVEAQTRKQRPRPRKRVESQ
jgi:hypothetical protein